MTPILSPEQVARVAAMSAEELDAWVLKALTWSTSPLSLHRDTTPELELRRLVENEPSLQLPLRNACRRLVTQLAEGSLQLSETLAEDILYLADAWKLEGLGPLLARTLEGEPQHPDGQRQLMMNLLIDQKIELPKEFWLSFFHRENGVLVVGAFRGLLNLDPQHALSLLSTIDAGNVRSASICIVVEQFFEDHPELGKLLHVVREQLPRCSADLRLYLTEWLGEAAA